MFGKRIGLLSVSVLTFTVATALVAGVLPARSPLSRSLAAQQPMASDLVVVTEDNAPGDNKSGCDAISVHDFRTGRVVDRGVKHISPGRVAARGDLSLIAANHSNGFGYTFPAQSRDWPFRSDGWLALRQPLDLSFGSVRDGIYGNLDAANLGGLRFTDDGALLMASATAKQDGLYLLPKAPFGVERLEFPPRIADMGTLPRTQTRIRTSGLIGEIVGVRGSGISHLVGIDGSITSVREDTLEPVGPEVSYPTAVAPRSFRSSPPVEHFHAAISGDGRHIFIGRMRAGDIAVVNLENASSSIVEVGPDVSEIGGLDVSRSWHNEGLVAVHAVSRLLVLAYDPEQGLTLRGALPVNAPRNGRNPGAHTQHGPALSVKWTGDGSHVILTADDGPSEFWVVEVSDGGRELTHTQSLTACPNGDNLGNGIWTTNGEITATPSATLPVTPSTTHTPTSLPTGTPSGTPTSVPSLTPTRAPTATTSPAPVPIFLPLALTESCDPTQLRIDVALVIDASSSMREPASPGSAETKLDAATKAVGTFLDVLALDEGDQAAIVSFSSDAWLHSSLTADRDELDEALASVEAGQQTRIDRGLQVATAALLDGDTRDPENEPVLVLLTDGRANPVPVDVAMDIAHDAKGEGITIFTIGLGSDVEVDALRQMASEPAFFLHAPTAAELEGVYREVARSIPCPPSAYWGGR